MRFLKSIIWASFIVLLLTSCTNKNKLNIDTSKINVTLNVTRFDTIFFNTHTGTFQKVKRQFGYYSQPMFLTAFGWLKLTIPIHVIRLKKQKKFFQILMKNRKSLANYLNM